MQEECKLWLNYSTTNPCAPKDLENHIVSLSKSRENHVIFSVKYHSWGQARSKVHVITLNEKTAPITNTGVFPSLHSYLFTTEVTFQLAADGDSTVQSEKWLPPIQVVNGFGSGLRDLLGPKFIAYPPGSGAFTKRCKGVPTARTSTENQASQQHDNHPFAYMNLWIWARSCNKKSYTTAPHLGQKMPLLQECQYQIALYRFT